MAEWLKAAVLKTASRVIVTGVRIPLPPPPFFNEYVYLLPQLIKFHDDITVRQSGLETIRRRASLVSREWQILNYKGLRRVFYPCIGIFSG